MSKLFRGLMAPILLAFLGLVPVQAATAMEAVTLGNDICELAGSGTEADPYLIRAQTHLHEMPDCGPSATTTTYFALTKNLDLGGINHNPIDFDSFLASSPIQLDGKGFAISGLSIFEDRSERGLFGDIGSLTVKNLNLYAPVVYGGGQTGVLAGNVNGDLVVENVNIVSGMFSGKWETGLLAGRVDGNATATDSLVYTEKMMFGDRRGGLLIGRVTGEMTTLARVTAVSDSFTLPSIEGQAILDGGIGGLVGELNSFTFQDVYAELRDHNERNHAPVTLSLQGGLIGIATPVSDSSMFGVQSQIDTGYPENFGGTIGELQMEDTGADGIALDFQNVLALADVKLAAGGSGGVGGFIGNVDKTAIGDMAFDIDVTNAILRFKPTNATGDVSGYTVKQDFGIFDETGIVTGFTASWYMDSWWNSYNANTAFFSAASDAALSTPNLGATFNPLIGGEGATLADYEWELCDGGAYPIITWVSSSCGFPADRTFSTVSASYEVNSAMTPITITNADNTRDVIERYSITPGLPKGLAMDAATGKIVGTPLEETPTTTYRLTAHFQLGSSTESISFATHMPDPEVVTRTVVREVGVAVDYKGAMLIDASQREVVACEETSVTFSAQNAAGLSWATVGGTRITHEVLEDGSLQFDLPCLEAGSHDLRLHATTGSVTYESLFLASDPEVIVEPETEAIEQVVNAGSFKGYVAVYAQGYEGQRLSAKIGKDWIIVEQIPESENDLFRVTDFTGAGVEIQVKIYIDRELLRTVPLTTK